jgi:hypothetical protein
MNNEKIMRLIKILAFPLLLAVLGAVLVISPDTASAIIAKGMAWLLLGFCALCVLLAAMSWQEKGVQMLITAVVCGALGYYILKNPLVLAENVGKFMGICLALQGISSVQEALLLKKHNEPYVVNLIMAIITIAVAAMLVLFPMTISRMVFRICGGVMLFVALGTFLARFRAYKAQEKSGKVIDAG